MLLRRLGTLPTASKRVLWKAITRKYCFCAYDIKLFSGQDSTSTGLHLKRPNTDTTSAVCICVMFALNLLLSEDQYQRGDLSLISLRRRKLLHHMRVQTHKYTDKTQCTINISHCTLETACLSILLKKNKLLHLTFAGPNTHTHTYTRTHAKNITPQPALLWLWQNSNCQQGSSFSHLASEKLRYPKQSLSPCGKAKNRMHLDIRSKQRSIPTLKCSFECTFHKTSLKKTKMPQLICADTRRHTDTHRHAHTNAHCTKHTIHSILRHVAEIKHADASQWYSKTHTHNLLCKNPFSPKFNFQGISTTRSGRGFMCLKML